MSSEQKLSVLFVDDEPALLSLIPRLLADMSADWRMEFAENAAKALEVMARVPIDVVVSDLHMPDKNGIELLHEIRELHPLTARILYSSFSDQWTILRCIGLAHQFLPKPCPREAFKTAIERATLLKSSLPNRDIREKISKLECIPSMPAVYRELRQKLQSTETPLEDIAALVSQDIGMTAQILKMANSVFFGSSRRTSSVAEAIGCLGLETIKHVVLALGIFSQFESQKLGGISLETLWNHSLRTASAARIIVKSEPHDRTLIDDTLAAGLLHDLGKLVLAGSYPERYEELGRRAQSKRIEWQVEERATFGFDHAEVGGYLLELWGLPDAVVEAVRFHHIPTRSNSSRFTPLSAVHTANVLVQGQRISHGGIVPPQIDHLYLAAIGRVEQLESWREMVNESLEL